MTVIIILPDGTEQKYEMINSVMEFHSSMDGNKSEICLIGYTKTFRFDRNVRVRVDELGPDPFFHDGEGKPIQERIDAWTQSANNFRARGGISLVKPKVTTVKKAKSSCIMCGEPSDESPCRKCARSIPGV